VAHGGEQDAIFKTRSVETGALSGREEAAEPREREAGFTTSETPKDDEDAGPQIVVAVEAGAPEGAVAETTEGVTLSVSVAGTARLDAIVRNVEEPALLNGKQKEATIDEAEELLEIVPDAEVAGLEREPEWLVVTVLDKSGAEGNQRLGDTAAKSITDALALLLPLKFPGFPDARVAGCGWGAGTAGVEEPLDGGEVRVALIFENQFEIGFEEGGAREGFGIANKTELAAVGEQRPRAGSAGVEELLRKLVGRATAQAGIDDGKSFIGRVEIERVWRNDNRDATTASERSDRVTATRQLDGNSDGSKIRVAECIAKKLRCECDGGAGGVDVLTGARRLKVFPKCGGNAERTALLIDQAEAFGKLVVRCLLRRVVSARRLFEHGGNEEASFKAKGIEDERVGGTAGHCGLKTVGKQDVNADDVHG
jgi:hypothetical protein